MPRAQQGSRIFFYGSNAISDMLLPETARLRGELLACTFFFGFWTGMVFAGQSESN